MTRQTTRNDKHGFLRAVTLVPEKIDDAERYPFSIPALRKLDTLELDRGINVFVGENGSGKSTLIEAIAIQAGLNAEGGSRNMHHSDHRTESRLHQALRLVRSTRRETNGFFLRAETMFNLATQVLKGGLAGMGWEDMHAKSHGEAFLWLVQNRFRPNGLFVLDEPEAALSPSRQLALLYILHELVGEGSQVLMATHAPILMAYPGARLYELGDDGIHPTELRDTEHYRVTKSFLDHPEAALRELMR